MRAQQFFTSNAHLLTINQARDKVLEMANEFGHSPFRVRSLYLELQKCSSSYRFHASLNRLANAPDATKQLKKIAFSMSKLATFSGAMLAENPREDFRIAERRIETKMHHWAKAQRDSADCNVQAEIDLEERGFLYHSWSDDAGNHEDFGSI